MDQLLMWFTSHPAIVATIASFIVALLDLVFALKPDWQSNGLLHWILLQAQSLSKKDVPPAA